MDKDVVMEITLKAGGNERKLLVAGVNVSEGGIDLSAESISEEEIDFVHSFLLDCADAIEDITGVNVEQESLH